jgi:hypothetical protein
MMQKGLFLNEDKHSGVQARLRAIAFQRAGMSLRSSQ